MVYRRIALAALFFVSTYLPASAALALSPGEWNSFLGNLPASPGGSGGANGVFPLTLPNGRVVKGPFGDQGVLPDLSNVTLPAALKNLLSNLHGSTYYAEAYGSCTWGTASGNNVAPCIQSAIDAATAAGGGVVKLPSGTFNVGSTVTIKDRVILQGAGATFNGSTLAITCTTQLLWSGSTGSPVIQSGTVAQTTPIAQPGLADLCINGNDVADQDLYIRGISRGVVNNVVMVGATAAGFDMDVSTGAAAGGMQYNTFSNLFIGLRSAGAANATGLLLGPGSTSSDINQNNFSNVRIATNNGDAFVCGNADTNVFNGLSAFPSGTGHSRFKAGTSASPVTGCRNNTFIMPAFGGSSIGGLIVEGTESDVEPSMNNWIFGFKKGGAEPYPQLGTGATLYGYATDGGQIFNSSPIEFSKLNTLSTLDGNASLTLTANDCGTNFANSLSGSSKAFILPAATGSGCIVSFAKTQNGTTVQVQTAGAPDIIVGPGTAVNSTSAGGYIYTNRVYSTIVIQDQSAGKWVVKWGSGYWLTDTGMPIGIGGMGLFRTFTATASPALNFTGLPVLADTLVLTCGGLVPANDGDNTQIQFSEDNGGTWKGANYSYAMSGYNVTPAAATLANASDSSIVVNASAVHADAANPLSLKAYIHNIGSTTANKVVQFESSYNNTTPVFETVSGSGKYTGDQGAVNAIRVRMSTGNIASGQCGLYVLVP